MVFVLLNWMDPFSAAIVFVRFFDNFSAILFSVLGSL